MDKPYLIGRSYLIRVHKGDDLLAAIQEFCRDNQIKCGIISGIGGLRSVVIGVYDLKTKKYHKKTMDGFFEILNLSGNVSIMDDRPMVHLHLTYADGELTARGGHLMAGSKVFAAEIFIQEIVGDPKIRKADSATGLPLWANVK